MLVTLMGVRTAILTLMAAGMISGCTDFLGTGMSAGLGSGEGTTSGGTGSSSSSTSKGDAAEATTGAASGSTAQADSASGEDSSDAQDSTMASTGADETTGPQTGFQDGTYTGPLNILMVSSLGDYDCVGEITLTVAEDDGPPVVGDGSCVVNLPIGAVTGLIEVTGELALPLADGPATLTTDVDSTETTWSGAFAGDTFTGNFNGVYTLYGYQVNYMGEWTLER